MKENSPSEVSGERSTIIEEGTVLQGRLSSTCGLLIRGSVDGEIDAPVVDVAISGRLTGTACVGDLRSEGHISGDFEAENVVLAGRVGDKTKIRARTLEARLRSEGAPLEVSFGESVLEVGEEPHPAEVSEEAQASLQN
ncbi:MAG: polymer-forming cytoskeletal protein [Deltaproteobacteria bacterium]|nr:polymer-forming cytoskeletal protein [Deltaproteobacteria bacterium]